MRESNDEWGPLAVGRPVHTRYDKAIGQSRGGNISCSYIGRSSQDDGIVFVYVQEGLVGQAEAIADLFGDWMTSYNMLPPFMEALC